MRKGFLSVWLPIICALFVAAVLMCWAVYEESNIQGSIPLPAGLAFQAYLPSRYFIYCEMAGDLTDKEAILANMRLFPTIACDVKGAGYLDVLHINVWRAGGLTRLVKDSGGSKIFMPFAEFEILWPGNYELKAGSIDLGSKKFLVAVAPTGVIVSAAFIDIIILIIVFLWLLRRKIKTASAKRELESHIDIQEHEGMQADDNNEAQENDEMILTGDAPNE